MSQWDKLIGKITSLSADLRFTELKKVLENCGYTMHAPKGGSSRHDPIKKVYVEMVKRVVENEEDNESN